MISTISKIQRKRAIKKFLGMIVHASESRASLNSVDLKKQAGTISAYSVTTSPLFGMGAVGALASMAKDGIEYVVQHANDRPDYVRILCVDIISEYSKKNSRFSKREVDDMVYKIICWQTSSENKKLEQALTGGVLSISLLNQCDFDTASILGDASNLIDFV